MKKVCANPGISEGGRWSRVQNEINQCKAFCFRSPRGGEGGPRPAPLPPVSIGGLGEGGQRGGFSKGAAPKNRLKYLKNRPFGRAAALVVPTVPWACSRATFVTTFRGPGKRCRPEEIGGNPAAGSKRVAVAPKWVSRNDFRCNFIVSGQMETSTKTFRISDKPISPVSACENPP